MLTNGREDTKDKSSGKEWDMRRKVGREEKTEIIGNGAQTRGNTHFTKNLNKNKRILGEIITILHNMENFNKIKELAAEEKIIGGSRKMRLKLKDTNLERRNVSLHEKLSKRILGRIGLRQNWEIVYGMTQELETASAA